MFKFNLLQIGKPKDNFRDDDNNNSEGDDSSVKLLKALS